MDLVLGAVTDLMFVVRIGDAAKRAGRQAVFAGTFERLMAQAAGDVKMVIVDLSCVAAEPVRLIEELKKRGVHVIAFGAHVDAPALKAAREAGADHVMPRSKFVQELDRLIAL